MRKITASQVQAGTGDRKNKKQRAREIVRNLEESDLGFLRASETLLVAKMA
nr:hypothetical protein Iba_scaffold1050CG0480 [Ipomoea batatas]GME04943.1 hypothetical protein Iba_scaffold2406CG0060 [Ipomoea batatas]GME05036.1 hypothetical protein Iba_scaffold2431CG0560 [Ipomoea batatas]